MPEIQTLLREYGEHLEELAPAIAVSEVGQVRVQPAGPAPVWRLVVFAAAAAVTVILLGVIPLIIFSTEEPATQPSPTPTTIVTPTTLLEPTPTTLVESPDVDLLAMLHAAASNSLRFGVRATSPSLLDRDDEPGAFGEFEALWFLPREDWQGWTDHPRVEDLHAWVELAPETRLQVNTRVWMAEFVDEAAASAFVSAYSAKPLEVLEPEGPCGGRCPMVPVVVSSFPVEVVAEEMFGFTGTLEERGPTNEDWVFAAVVGIRQGRVVAIVSVPAKDEPLPTTSDPADEARYLAAWLAAVMIGEEPGVAAPPAEPLTDDENRAISLIHDYHAALNAGDYDKVVEILWPTRELPGSDAAPPVRDELIFAIEPLLEDGAVFEVSGCRPYGTQDIGWEGDSDRLVPDDPGGNSINDLLEVECYSGYRTNSKSEFGYHTFWYKDGHLLILGTPYGEDWSP